MAHHAIQKYGLNHPHFDYPYDQNYKQAKIYSSFCCWMDRMIETERLILRQWQARDHATFIKMGLDPDVMKYFPRCLTPEESLNFVDSVTSFIDKNGWGFGAIELKQMHEFIGFIGLRSQPTQFDFSPCMEIAWRLAKQFWQKAMPPKALKLF